MCFVFELESNYAECLNANCHNVECHAEGHYGKCHKDILSVIMISIIVLQNKECFLYLN
jgi:hypothetical protein